MAKLIMSVSNLEAGVDEVGRGCVAGPVVAATVILPLDYYDAQIKDSKKINKNKLSSIADSIKSNAIAYAIAEVDVETIDSINILQASMLAMKKAILDLNVKPELLLIDGNYWIDIGINYQTVIKGDAKYQSIAAASILAKQYRDQKMLYLHDSFPEYGWDSNVGYGTIKHKQAISKYGLTIHHRKSFNIKL